MEGGMPRVNIYDISRHAGVSIATVSRVLNNSPHVSEETRRKVMKVIDGCGYVPNAFARGLGLNTMKTIGLLCPDAADPYLARALACLEHAFRQKHYDCLLSCTNRDLAARRQGVELLTSRHVDGMVLMGSTFIEENSEDNAYIRQAATNVPVVLLNGSFQCPNVFCVLCDDERAMKEAMNQLLDSGCKRVLYLYHSSNNSGQRKLAGCRDALAAHNLPVDETLMRRFDADKFSIHAVRDCLMELEREGLQFDAVLASEDVLAVGAMKYAQAVGRRAGESVRRRLQQLEPLPVYRAGADERGQPSARYLRAHCRNDAGRAGRTRDAGKNRLYGGNHPARLNTGGTRQISFSPHGAVSYSSNF